MKVMVTGATTPLGAAIIDHLLRVRDVELVLAVGREPSDAPLHDRVLYRTADLTRTRVLHDLLWGDARAHGISTVIHAMHHRDARDEGSRVHAQNVEATRALVVACAEHPTIRRFVYRSFGDIYASRTQDLVDEDAPLDFGARTPAWLRDRLEADLAVCAHLGGSLEVAVLRCAEIFAAGCGSQLWDFLASRVCVRPFGFDPMLNLLSLDDAASAFGAAIGSPAVGVFNIPGFDTLPLSRALAESMRLSIAVPGLGARRLGNVLDGRRAREAFGYVPHTPVVWPRPWWRRLIDELMKTQAETNSP